MKSEVKIVVIGAGIIGTTTAVCLLEAGYTDITLLSKDDPLHTNSDAAAALWRPYDGFPEDKFLNWCNDSLSKFDELSKIKESGVLWIASVELYREAQRRPKWMSELEPVNVPQEIKRLREEYPYIYASKTILANSQFYRPFLLRRFKNLGGKFLQRKINNFSELASHYQIIINCAGEQARFLADDNETYPVRGQVLKVKFPPDFMSPSYAIVSEEPFAFIIPRANSNDWIIGATYQADISDPNPRKEDTECLLDNAEKLWPGIKENAEILDIQVGFRCARNSVRLEVEDTENYIIHNYGHGGGGYTASWGCANEVVRYCKRYTKGSL